MASNWGKIYRGVLLTILAYEATGCMLGGGMLIAAPDGKLLDMPVKIMNGAFRDFLIPGIILFMLGILNTSAFVSSLLKLNGYRVLTGLALGGMLIWFWVEIAILQQLHWLHGMWGGPVIIAIPAALMTMDLPFSSLRKGLLVCGIVASVLCVFVVIITGAQYPGYNAVSQTISELSATGTPTRVLWIVLATPYALLMLAFVTGLWLTVSHLPQLRAATWLITIYSILTLLWFFYPMHQRPVLAAGGGTMVDTAHLTLGAITEILAILALLFTAFAMPIGFRLYSLITLTFMVIFGIITVMEAPAIEHNKPTPMIEVWERINIGLFLLWIGMLAIHLLPEYTKPRTKIKRTPTSIAP